MILRTSSEKKECLWVTKSVKVKRMTVSECKETFEGHEIAAHSLTYHGLASLDDCMIERQIVDDRANIENLFDGKVADLALHGDSSCIVSYAAWSENKLLINQQL